LGESNSFETIKIIGNSRLYTVTR